MDAKVQLNVIGIGYIDMKISPSEEWVKFLGNRSKGILKTWFCNQRHGGEDGIFGDGDTNDNMCRSEATNIIFTSSLVAFSPEYSVDFTANAWAHELGHGMGMW